MRSLDPDKRPCPARLRARCAAACAAGRSRLRAERGSALIEVMVGAVVLSIATVGLLNGLDGAQGIGTQNKARSTASAVGEQDQERLRSMDVKTLVQTLAGKSSLRIVTVRGVDYTVTSSASWAVDEGGVVSCSNNSKTAANLRIVSEVSSNATQGVIDVASLVTPPPGSFGENEGRAIVKVNNRNGNPISGVSVSLSGTASASATTSSLGCAIFPFMPAGPYTATISGLGLVDWQGSSPVTKGLTVTEGTSTTASVELDTAAEIRANFDTVVNGTTVTANVRSQFLTVLNSKLTVGFETFEASPTGSPNTLVTAAPLFPFLDGYGVYAGKCAANNPANAPTNNAGLLQNLAPTPGQIMTTPRVRVPAINVRVLQVNGTTVQPNATIIVKGNDTGCTPAAGITYPTQLSNAAAPTAPLTPGGMPQPGFPYGSYKICAQAVVGSLMRHGHADVRLATGYDAKSTNAYQAESVSNRVDDTVFNTTAAGNNTLDTAVGAIRLRLNRNGACE